MISFLNHLSKDLYLDAKVNELEPRERQYEKITESEKKKMHPKIELVHDEIYKILNI